MTDILSVSHTYIQIKSRSTMETKKEQKIEYSKKFIEKIDFFLGLLFYLINLFFFELRMEGIYSKFSLQFE